MAVQWPYTSIEERIMATTRTRTERIEVRTTPEDRDLIDRAVTASNTGLTDFVIVHLRLAALRVLADRDEFTLDAEAASAWDRLNQRPARDLPGMRALLSRPSPFEG
jgi:uncharacterized protein (DUF1778 family)